MLCRDQLAWCELLTADHARRAMSGSVNDREPLPAVLTVVTTLGRAWAIPGALTGGTAFGTNRARADSAAIAARFSDHILLFVGGCL